MYKLFYVFDILTKTKVKEKKKRLCDIWFSSWCSIFETETWITYQNHESLRTREAIFALMMTYFCLFSCLALSWLGDMKEKQHKHKCRYLSLGSESSRADMKCKMKSEMLLFISKLKNREKGLWHKHHITRYSFALNEPKVGFSLLLHFSAAGKFHWGQNSLLKTCHLLYCDQSCLMFCCIIFHTAVLQVQHFRLFTTSEMPKFADTIAHITSTSASDEHS